MDMCMLDVTEVNCQEGDEVIVFDSQAEIKKMAMAGHHDAAKILSKDIAKNRVMRKQYLMMGSQLKSMEM